MIIAQLSISPVGKDVSLSKFVKIVLKILKDEPLTIKTNAMATVIESSDLDTLFNAVKKAHNELFKYGVDRVITELKVDDRKDKNVTILSKLNSLNL